MGYYSTHRIKLSGYEGNPEFVFGKLRQDCEEAEYSIDIFGDSTNQCKWYGAVDDICQFSTKFPEILFEYERIGEDLGDYKMYYIKDGKYQEATGKIVYEKFNPKLLK